MFEGVYHPRGEAMRFEAIYGIASNYISCRGVINLAKPGYENKGPFY